jgi:hypothetical protein
MTPAPDPLINPPKLVAAGISDGKQLNDEPTQIVDLDLHSAKSLGELLKDYTFYTPALLHLTVPFQVDPFDLFCAEYGQPVTRFSVRFDKPVFAGLTHPTGDTTWNYVLFGLPCEHWEAYQSWIGSCAFDDAQKKLLRRVRIQNLTIRDPLSAASKAIPVTALVIESNRGSFYYKTDPISWRPTATFDASLVYKDTVDFAEALAAGISNPYAYVEKQQHARENTLPGSN